MVSTQSALTSTLSLPRVIKFKFPLQPHQKYYIIQYEELGFPLHASMKDDCATSLRYCTSLIHFTLKGWENVLFELGSERVKYLRVF